MRGEVGGMDGVESSVVVGSSGDVAQWSITSGALDWPWAFSLFGMILACRRLKSINIFQMGGLWQNFLLAKTDFRKFGNRSALFNPVNTQIMVNPEFHGMICTCK